MVDVRGWQGVDRVGSGSRVRLKISRRLGSWVRGTGGGDLGAARVVGDFHFRSDGSMGLCGLGVKLLKGLGEILVNGIWRKQIGQNRIRQVPFQRLLLSRRTGGPHDCRVLNYAEGESERRRTRHIRGIYCRRGPTPQ